MHRAPAVSFPLGRSRWALRVLVALGTLGGMGWLAYVMQVEPWGWQHNSMLLTVLLAAGSGYLAWWRTPCGSLRWDGEAWSIDYGLGEQPASVQLVLDFQSAMVLQWWPAGGSKTTCWVEARSDPRCWIPLRRAVVSSARRLHQAPSHVHDQTERRA